MPSSTTALSPPQSGMCAERLGVAKLTRMAFSGLDLIPLHDELAQSLRFDGEGAGPAMDFAMLCQLLGDQPRGMAIQSRVLQVQRLYHSASAAPNPRLRVLAFAADMDIGGNTPLEFLLRDSAIELYTLYVVPGLPWPAELPEHDIAIACMPDDDRCRTALDELELILPGWPRPLLNPPQAIARLDRDRLYVALLATPGLKIPATLRLPRDRLDEYLPALGTGPLVIRPVGSHAGRHLARLDHPGEIATYLAACPAAEFFVSPYVDYRGAGGLFRKYRIVLVNGCAFPSHMAISEQWKIWYLNANMRGNPAKRAEERDFMDGFDDGFAVRHAGALAEFHRRVGLD